MNCCTCGRSAHLCWHDLAIWLCICCVKIMIMIRHNVLRLWTYQQMLSQRGSKYLSYSIPQCNRVSTLQMDALKRPRRDEKVPATVLHTLRSSILLRNPYRKTIYRRQLISFLNDCPEGTIAHNLSNEDLKEKLEQSKPKEIIEVLKSISKKTKSNEVVSMCNQVIQGKVNEFSTDELLYIADIHFMSGTDLTDYCNWLFHVLVSQTSRLGLNLHQAVHVMFLVGLRRNAPVTLLHELEEILAAGHQDLSSEELGLICNGFYASNRSLSNVSLLEGLCVALLRDGHRLDLTLVANMLKSLRHADYGMWDDFMQLGHILSRRQDITSTQFTAPLAAIATAYSSARVRHETLFKTLTAGISYSIKKKAKIRLKDIARFTLTCSTLQIIPPQPVVDTLIRCLQQEELAWRQYPEVCTEGVLALVILGKYPLMVINKLLAPDNMKAKTRRLLEQRMQHIYVDTAVGIEQPKYTGHRLHHSECAGDWLQMERSAFASIRGVKVRKREALAVLWQSVVELAGGLEYVACHAILPFTKVPDLELHLDHEHNLMKFRNPDDLNLEQESQLLRPIKELAGQSHGERSSILSSLLPGEKDRSSFQLEIQHLSPLRKIFAEHRVSIKVMGFNQYLRTDPLLLGMHQREIQLLRRAGYHVVVIPPNWSHKIQSLSKADLTQFVQTSIIRGLS